MRVKVAVDQSHRQPSGYIGLVQPPECESNPATPHLYLTGYQTEDAVQTNIGTVDRTLRIVVGLALIGLAVTGTIGVWGWIGVIPVLTGLVRICPLYSLLGVRTCPASGGKPG